VTKTYSIVDVESRPIRRGLTGGKIAELVGFEGLIARIKESGKLLADKDYDTHAIRTTTTGHEISANIPHNVLPAKSRLAF